MILITGGMGFIGLHTARSFIDAGEEVVLTQYRKRREPEFIRDEFGKAAKVEQLDVADAAALEELVSRYPVSGIVHLAVPGLGALGPGDEYRMNTQGLINILEAGHELGVRTTIASSVAVYTGLSQGPWLESDPLPIESQSPTEAYKKAEETLGCHYADRTGMDVVYLRIGQIYGPLYHSMRNLPSRLTHAAVRGEELQLNESEQGPSAAHQSADLCYVKDCARGIQLTQTAGKLGHRTYNLGAGTDVSPRQVLDAVSAAVPGATMPDNVPPRASEASRHMSIERIHEDVSYTPEFDIERGIADYAAWLQTNDV